MKTHMAVIIALLLIALGVQAQQPGMSQEQMMQMMQQAQQMQACFAKVDQQALMALGQKAQAMESEIKRISAAKRKAQPLNSVWKCRRIKISKLPASAVKWRRV